MLTLNAWEQKDSCIVLFNTSNAPIEVEYWYVKATPSQWTFNCESDLWSGIFASMFSVANNKIDIPANSNKVIYDKMFLPPWLSGWLINGCISYWVNEKTTRNTDMFAIAIRRAARLDVLVNGKSDIKSLVYLDNQKNDFYVSNKKIKVIINENNEIILSLLVVNSGNVNQIFNVSGSIDNFLGFQKKFSLENQIVWAYETKELSFNIGIIPSYKWLFNINISANNTPSLMYKIPWLENELKPGSFYEKGKLFIFSWIVVGALLVVILLIYKLFWPRRTKVLFPQQQ